VFGWEQGSEERFLIAVNYAANQSQCYVRLPSANLSNHSWWLEDLLSDARYERDGSDLESRGLYLDMAPWGYHVFKLQKAS
jgi:hypothetical protein